MVLLQINIFQLKLKVIGLHFNLRGFFFKFCIIIFPFFVFIISATCKIEGKVLELSVWDTAGKKESDNTRGLIFPGTHAFLLCFSVDDIDSYGQIKDRWIPIVNSYMEMNNQITPFFVVGLKADLRPGEKEEETIGGNGKKFIRWYEAEIECKTNGSMGYFECTSKNPGEATEVYNGILKALLAAYQKAHQKGGNEVDGDSKTKKCLIM